MYYITNALIRGQVINTESRINSLMYRAVNVIKIFYKAKKISISAKPINSAHLRYTNAPLVVKIHELRFFFAMMQLPREIYSKGIVRL